MGAIRSLEILLETDKVSGEAVHHVLDALWSDERIEGLGWTRSSVRKVTAQRIQGEVPTEAVWDGICQHEIRRNGPGRDLEIVIGVSPATETRFGIRVKDRRRIKVVSI